MKSKKKSCVQVGLIQTLNKLNCYKKSKFWINKVPSAYSIAIFCKKKNKLFNIVKNVREKLL